MNDTSGFWSDPNCPQCLVVTSLRPRYWVCDECDLIVLVRNVGVPNRHGPPLHLRPDFVWGPGSDEPHAS